MRRVLMYSQDGKGLGHLRRSFNIARELRLQDPGCEVLIAADSPALSIVGSVPGVDLIKLPTLVKAGPRWENGTLLGPTDGVVRLRSRMMLDVMVEFRPDTVLVDHMPVGAMGELKAMLDHAAALRRPPKMYLGLRDVLDRPAVVQRSWRRLGVYEYLPLYDAVLIYGDREVYDASMAYRLVPSARSIVYCNYIAPRRAAPTPAAAAEQPPFVLMMGGGGGDAFPLAQAFVESMRRVSRELGATAVLLTGPNMAAHERDRLLGRAAESVRVEGRYGDAMEWIRAAAAVVTMAGYNSLCEVLTWQKKAAVVPRPGPSAEQRIRSDVFSRRSLIRRLEPEALSPRRLADVLIRLLTEDGVPDVANIPRLNGAHRVAGMLLERAPLVEERVPVAAVNGHHRRPAPGILAGPAAEASAL